MAMSIAKLKKEVIKMNKELTFEKKLERLEKILDEMNNKTLSLDESLALYSEGQNLIEDLKTALKDAEEKVEKIIN